MRSKYISIASKKLIMDGQQAKRGLKRKYPVGSKIGKIGENTDALKVE